VTTQTASFRTKVVRALVGLGASASAIGLVVSSPASAIAPSTLSLPFAESMTGPTLSDPNWLLSGTATLTGTAIEPGMMQLTPASGGLGSAILNTPIDTSETFTVDFDYVINGDADGLSMFLIDGAETSPAPGAGGGFLGYASDSTNPGATGGYVSVGFTEYYGAPGGRGIRLVGSGSGTAGYSQIAFKSEYQLGASVTTNNGHARAIFDHGVVTLDIASGRIFDHVDLTAVVGQAALPPTVKLGFAGATGGLVATHQIRNVSLGLQSDTLHVAPSFTVNSQTGELSISADLTNNGPDAVPDAQLEISSTGTAAFGPDWTCVAVASATCPEVTTGPIRGISLPAGDGQVTVMQQVTGAVRGDSVTFNLSSASDPTRPRTEVLQLSYPNLFPYGDNVPKNSAGNTISVYGLPAGWVIESPIADNGTVTVSTDGASLLYTPDPDYVGPDMVSLSVRNGRVLATNYTTEITVLNNSRPTATWTAPASVAHNSTIDIPLTLADIDDDTVTVDDWWTNSSACLDRNGATLTYDPSCGGEGGFVGTDTVYFGIWDGNFFVRYQFDIEVTDQAPTATFTTPTSVGHGSTIDIPLTLADADEGDTVSVRYYGTEDMCVSWNGSALTYDPTCDGDWNGYTGTDTVYFTITDGAVDVDYEFDIAVLGPTATTAVTTVQEGKSVTIPVTLSDPSGHILTLVSSGPDFSPFRTLAFGPVESNGTYTIEGSNLVYTPNEGFVGEDTITFWVMDDNGQPDIPWSSSSFGPFEATLTVRANHAPTAAVAAASVETGSSVTIPITLADADDDAVTLVGAEAANGSVEIDGSNLVYTPTAGYVGPDEISFSFADYLTQSDAVVAVTVRPFNHPPTATVAPAVVETGSSVTIPVTLADADDDAVAITGAEASHGAVVIDGSALVYTPTAGYVGPDEISFSFADSLKQSNAVVAVTVRPLNSAPTPPPNDDPTPEISGEADDDLSVVIDGVTDANGDTLSFDIATPPQHGTISLEEATSTRRDGLLAATVGVNGLRVIYTPYAGFTGTDSFTYRVSDDFGGSYSRTVTVNVLAAATAPTASNIALLKSLPISARLLDTRSAGGLVTETRVTVNSPQDGAALNVTVVGQKSPGFVTVWPCDKPRPNTSNVNFGVGSAVPNAVNIAPAADGTVCLFSSTPANLIVDQSGSWSTAGGFVGQTPDRMIDTRNKGGKITTVEVPGFDITRATFLNITVIDPKDAGFVTVWPCASPKPDSSNVNFRSGETRAAAALVKPDANGKVCIFSSTPAHLLMDRTGSLPADRVDTSHAGRLLDTRNAASRMKAGVTNLLPASNSIRYINVTAVETTGAGFATIYGDKSPKPTTSNVNYGANVPSSNTTAIGAGNGITSYASTDWRVIIDLQAEIN
jgi:Bacterial Ig domain/Bacterial lectin